MTTPVLGDDVLLLSMQTATLAGRAVPAFPYGFRRTAEAHLPPRWIRPARRALFLPLRAGGVPRQPRQAHRAVPLRTAQLRLRYRPVLRKVRRPFASSGTFDIPIHMLPQPNAECARLAAEQLRVRSIGTISIPCLCCNGSALERGNPPNDRPTDSLVETTPLLLDEERREYVTLDRITVEPGKMNGQPCIRGMRITVKRVLRALAEYPDRDDFRRTYPDLDDEDIRQALAYAAANPEDHNAKKLARLGGSDPDARAPRRRRTS